MLLLFVQVLCQFKEWKRKAKSKQLRRTSGNPLVNDTQMQVFDNKTYFHRHFHL